MPTKELHGCNKRNVFRRSRMSSARKVVRSLVVVGVLGGLAAGALSAFSSQTENPGNVVTAGTVTIADNDGATALYSLTAAKPGDSQTSCIRVVYSGSLDADVRLYTPDTVGDLGPHVDLKIEPGSQASPSFPSCTGFNADSGGAIFDDSLDQLPTSYAAGVEDLPDGASEWTSGDAVVYRVTATLSASAPAEAQGDTTGTHAIRWEATNQ
jgi:hypothetical protein